MLVNYFVLVFHSIQYILQLFHRLLTMSQQNIHVDHFLKTNLYYQMFLNVRFFSYVYVIYKMLLLIELVHHLIKIYPIYEVLKKTGDNLNNNSINNNKSHALLLRASRLYARNDLN